MAVQRVLEPDHVDLDRALADLVRSLSQEGEMSDEESTEYYTLLCDDPSHEVVLIDCGPCEREVILAVRMVTGQSLWRSWDLARQAPVALLGGLSAYRAQSAVAVLQSAGAIAEWRQELEPGERTATSP
ncbi:ribosomal protein L7/L12 [Streptomyces griseosporeus]|uniref:ribosomal protein L7/L12 n=1 Tax=Streptomyces griseosporeus TaxID=1910 RepID=UPI00198F0CFF|nr:hypothetical protein GCM10018783_58320 [Streptomyces griseosporeus]